MRGKSFYCSLTKFKKPCITKNGQNMGTQDNMKEKILKTPTAKDIGPKELQSFLKSYGFILKRSTGSHYIYAYPTDNKTFMLNIPMHSPVKPAYIDMIRDIICEIER